MVAKGCITVPEPLEGCLGLSAALKLACGLGLGTEHPVRSWMHVYQTSLYSIRLFSPWHASGTRMAAFYAAPVAG